MTLREIDIQIAEKVFNAKVTLLNQKHGWRIDYVVDKEECQDPIRTDYGNEGYQLKRYSTDIKAAFEVVDFLRNPNRAFSLVSLLDRDTDELEWIAKWEIHDPNYRFVFSTHKNPAQAICEVSLMAVEENNG